MFNYSWRLICLCMCLVLALAGCGGLFVYDGIPRLVSALLLVLTVGAFLVILVSAVIRGLEANAVEVGRTLNEATIKVELLLQDGLDRQQVQMEHVLRDIKLNRNEAENTWGKIFRSMHDEKDGVQRELRAYSDRLIGIQSSLERIQSKNEQGAKLLDDDRWLTRLVNRGAGSIKTEIVREVEALIQLHKLLQINQPVPLLGGWAMDPVSLLGIVELILDRKPSLVVEFGGGTSTVWLGYALKLVGGGRLISIDHLDEYLQKTDGAVRRHGLTGFVETRLAPLESIEIDGVSYNWYQKRVLDDLGLIDMVLVDGPPAKSGPAARYPAVPLVSPRLHKGSLIILDDADRAAETKIAKKWLRENSGMSFQDYLGERTKLYRWD